MSWWCVGLSEKWKYWITRKWMFDMHFVAPFYSCLSILTSLMLAICSDADTAARCWQSPEHKVHGCEGWIHKTRQAEAFADVSLSLQRQYDTIVHCKCCLDFKTEIQEYQSIPFWILNILNILNILKSTGAAALRAPPVTWELRCDAVLHYNNTHFELQKAKNFIFGMWFLNTILNRSI